ncbi:MAG: hypothetical protein O2818_02215 [Bacteroidetes bacterium]|nr:hypothetical protein [Bacteroidota bacterium]MDA1335679.1 hypothetical protein [Bacteroidota bacterium]
MSRTLSILAFLGAWFFAANSVLAADSEWQITNEWDRKDSIIVDGKVIQVQAAVSFDSLSRAPRTTNNFSVATAFELNQAVGMGGRGEDDEWRKWTGEFDRAWTMQVSFSPSKSNLNRYDGTVRWSPSIAFGVNRWSIQHVNLENLPDSLIGFIPNSSLSPLQGVIYERFPIGVETDTLTIPVERNDSFIPHVMLGLSMQSNSWNGTLSIGFMRISAHTERILLRAPSLTEEPFVFGDDVDGMWRPRMEFVLGYQFAQSPWSVRFSAQKILGYQQDQWIGVGLRYEFVGP